MRTLLFALLLVGGACAHSKGGADGTSQGATPEKQPGAPGSLVIGTTDRHLSTEGSDEGDRFTVEITTPVKDRKGRLWPKGCLKAQGHVREVQEGEGPKAPRLELEIDQIVANGQGLRAGGVVVWMQKDAMEEQPDKDGAKRGRAAGLVLGGIFFGVPGAVLGNQVGAVGGHSKSMVGREVQLRLPRGAMVTIRLDEPPPLERLGPCRAPKPLL